MIRTGIITSIVMGLLGLVISLFISFPVTSLSIFVFGFTTILTIQVIVTIAWMTYAWLEPDKSNQYASPKHFHYPHHGFSILVPARHEEKVIGDTIRSLANLTYHYHLYEALILCRTDDLQTIAAAESTIAELGVKHIRLITFEHGPINKPHALNIGLKHSHHEVIAIFDAEDEPHTHILNIVNTVMIRDQSDVVQAGVQLMNFRSNWFSTLNVLEYFFWFRSGLIFFNKLAGVTPLGGNTVFFRRQLLEANQGWAEDCLTEDALMGIELANQNARFSIVYDPNHTTKEETPHTLHGFVKQRTRWNQGYLQILFSSSWRNLTSLKQQLLVIYLLSQPVWLAITILMAPLITILSLIITVPLYSFVPLYLLGMVLLVQTFGLIEFAQIYRQRLSIFDIGRLWLSFIPYLVVVIVSSLRAMRRMFKAEITWEKTNHVNAHRVSSKKLVVSS